MSDLQGNSKNEAKRRRISPSATEHAEYKESEELSPPSPASSEERLSLGGEIDLVFKTEPMDDEGAETDAGPSADQKEDTGLDEDMIEELKVEFEDDPLTFGEANVSLTMDEVATHDKKMPAHRLLSQSQVEVLLSYMDQHRDLASSALSKQQMPESKRKVKRLWEELASLINNVDDARTKKSGDAWRTYWGERKYSVRKKAMKIQHSLSTGKPGRLQLNDEELKILDVMGKQVLKTMPPGMESFQDEDSSQSSAPDPLSKPDKLQSHKTPQKQSTLKTEISHHPRYANVGETDCDVDFSPGCYENLPLIDPLAVTEYFAALPDYDKAEMRALWRQPRELLNDTIGYVQIQREHATCTVKCEVASKTTSNSCCITYDEDNNRIVNTFCECLKLGCSHELAAAIWVCRREGGPGTYWLQPMVTRDPKSMTISAIFGFPKKKIQKKCSFLEDFLKICQENKVFTPAIMRHYHEDDRTKASLHKLMCKFKRNNNLEADGFLEYCKKAITNKDCVKALETMSVDVRQELEYGRITDALLHEVSQAADDVEELVKKITLPGAEEREEVNAGIIQSLEKSMKMSITPCGLIISNKSPIFAASPYGTTPTHVVYIKHLAGDSGDDYTGKTLSAKNYACMQLQMYLAKKKNGCFCAVHKSNRIDIMIVKQNQAMMRNLIWKATEFWKTHIFKAINMENAD